MRKLLRKAAFWVLTDEDVQNFVIGLVKEAVAELAEEIREQETDSNAE